MNAIRCCIACILPCGALDVIRIVHTNGRVEELTGSIHAAEVMKAHPKHILKKPCSTSATIVIVSPDVELQRGEIYFLIPVAPTASTSSSKKTKKQQQKQHDQQGGKSTAPSSPLVTSTSSSSRARRKRRESSGGSGSGSGSGCNKLVSVRANMVFSDQYLSEILSENEKISRSNNQRERRRGRVAVWRPHLESICEDSS